MSSDCFTVRVGAVNGTELTLDVLTLTAGGVTDLCYSRSFALRLLDDALRRAADVVPGRWTEQGRAAAAQLFERAERTALRAALPDDQTRWYTSETWMRENVGRFIASSTLVERRNVLDKHELLERERVIEEQHGSDEALRWERCHNFTLAVVLTDPRWGEHLEVGLVFPTTAYDVWVES